MPEQFGAYEIERRIGAGGMAEVFLAHRRGPEGFAKRVALKRVLPAYNADAEFVRLFQDEARLAARLDHPHVASLHDFGEVGGAWFMAMEYVEGADLRTVLAGLKQLGQPLPTDLVLLVAVDLASALLYAHELELDGRPASVIHRDVTPSNILVSVDGAIRLADFGIAKAATHGHHTRTGIVKGKVPYMPPEQALGQDMDHRVDLFAMGVVLYECIVGKRPYDGVTELDTLQRISKGTHAPLHDVAPHAPPALTAVIERLIRPAQGERFASAADVLDALATTPPPTNARRLLGNLVRRVQKEVPAVGRDVLPRPATPPRPAQGDERTRPMKPAEPGWEAALVTRVPEAPLPAWPPLPEKRNHVVVGVPSVPPPDPATMLARRPAVDAEPGSVLPAGRVEVASAGARVASPSAARARAGLGRIAVAVAAAFALATAATVALYVAIASTTAPPSSAKSAPPVAVAPAIAVASAPPAAPSMHEAGSARAPAQPQAAASAATAPVDPAASVPVVALPRSTERATVDVRRAERVARPAETIAATERASQSSTDTAPRDVAPLGRLQIVALPVGAVTIDGRSYGSSPVSASLRPGRHTIVAQNGEREESRTVELVAGATERVVFRFPMSD